jgi:hypothetical protein
MTNTFKNFQEAVEFYEDRESIEGEDTIFLVEGCCDRLQLLDTAYDVVGTAFAALADRIKQSGGKVHFCSEWHNGFDDKSGFIILSHEDLSLADKIAAALLGRVEPWCSLAG